MVSCARSRALLLCAVSLVPCIPATLAMDKRSHGTSQDIALEGPSPKLWQLPSGVEPAGSHGSHEFFCNRPQSLQWQLSGQCLDTRLGFRGFLTRGFVKAVGETELVEIPEGYIPEQWEYYKHPILRWIFHTFSDDPENNYERTMSVLQTETEKAELQIKELEVQRLMWKRRDGPWYQYLTIDRSIMDHSPKATPSK
ncbi:NADH dehydrogenase [ubiquinone] 1 beta subcomplex subunit 5, mitochondrial [Symphalangus syndactylus]|uniref:NADH dehydrogenase [ubiquinone] 1 beta subcomplex subunit 5, mitochondrial n=1 Tax=Symphalangus syndactylus TaxID=9590 RepID=UPI00244212DA|nr:NADH dehydrogenase [ubiquinone] 1 beta subcomplex subunit 5, mitochondrial [Symphalangus syndactylus]